MPVARDRFGFRRDFNPRRLEAPGVSYTYAIWDSAGAIKLGTSLHHPSERLGELQVGNANRLRLLAYSLSISERRAHRLMAPAHLRGEWFRLSPRLLSFVGRFDWVDGRLLLRLWRMLHGGGRRMCYRGIRAVWHL
jgi:hypothetical protein